MFARSVSRLRHAAQTSANRQQALLPCSRALSTEAKRRRKVTVIPGDGIGPEVTRSVVNVFSAMKVPIDWESYNVKDFREDPQNDDRLSEAAIDSMHRNKFVLKGPLYTPTGGGFRSPDVTLANRLDLFAHVVPVKSLPYVKARHDKVDMVIIRESTEGEYSGLEHAVNDDVVQSIKVITQKACRKIAEYAFEYAVANGRKKVTAVHKANIMKMADGLFLQCCREVAGLYHGKVEFSEVIIDNCCMQLVAKPEQFDVLVTTNLYGNIVGEAAAGLAGGVGLIPGYNYGPRVRIYEQGCRHIGYDIAGQNLANPASILGSSVLMLRDMGFTGFAESLSHGISRTLRQGDREVLTADIGGCGTTTSFTQAVIDNMDQETLQQAQREADRLVD